MENRTEPVGSPELPAWPEWLDIATAARYLQISISTLRSLLREPNHPPVARVTDRLYRVHRPSLDHWLEQRAAGAKTVDQVIAELRCRS